jgi:hypothetical protein
LPTNLLRQARERGDKVALIFDGDAYRSANRPGVKPGARLAELG